MNFRDTQGQDFVLETAQGWRRHKRRLLAIGSAALVALLLGVLLTRYLAASGSVSLSRLEVATVQQGAFVRDIAADGRVVAAVSPMLYAVAAGTVRYQVQAGDAVQRNAVLGIVASPELTNRLAQEQATLQSLSLAYENAHLDAQKKRLAARQKLEDARIDLKSAQTDLDRNTRAYKMGAVPEINVLRAQDALDKAQISLRHAEQDQGLDNRMVAFEIRSKRLAAERQQLIVADLQRQVDALTLRAPVTGQVGQLAVADRTKVAKDAALLSVVDLSALEVEIKVPESFARDLAPGMHAEISGDGQRWPGVVGAISPEVVGGEVAARVRFASARPAGLRQNQRLSVRVVLQRVADAITVARGPSLDSDGGSAVYVLHGDLAVRTPVRLGPSSIDRVQILAGLQPGERVVVAGAESFHDAPRVVISH
ncbi:efflux RND transporter periplasmic adaptor subunit [Metallibacterium sp.]|jgi:HlyD family secretion protein|uniref:efflux RND transporter periplasmic adaptor subunit n=1 Tax=Metallibacterium sp. TaxID=2940281 RepID=UPI002634D5C2|nr:efflux RND transporter periplasmic adaptor subunit [Metallibacterium sp.]